MPIEYKIIVSRFVFAMGRLAVEKKQVGPDRRLAKAFTLIELLIVVAIIAILAAIAVPNFLEAQTRAKVARVVGELRAVALALESYRNDWDYYPVDLLSQLGYGGDPEFFGYGDVAWFTNLTTPIAYMTSVNLIDPFNLEAARRPHPDHEDRWLMFHDALGYGYINLPIYRPLADVKEFRTPPYWVLISKGPDHYDADSVASWGNKDPNNSKSYTDWTYDPTNGTVSFGDIVRWGP